MPKKSTERKVRRKSLKVKRKSRRKPKKVKSKSRRKPKKVKSKSRRKSSKVRRKSKRKSSKVKSKSRRKVKRQIKRKVKGKSTYGTRYAGERTLVDKCFKAKSGGGSGYRDLSKIDHIPVVYNIKWEGGEFKIMFWNIQGTSSRDGIWSRDKMNCVIDIVHGHNPHLVFFSEVSYLLEENFLNGYRLLEESKEFTKHGEQGTKDLRMYSRLDSPFTYAREKRSGGCEKFVKCKTSTSAFRKMAGNFWITLKS